MTTGPKTPAPGRPVIIGIAGGIGSGKSHVAAVFARLGCVVSDSDRQAREALTRREVVDTLRAWWGDGVAPGGVVDRAAVAHVVFHDPAQRAKLEQLIHPLVHAQRADEVVRAAASGKRAVVVDAPLLFEAGIDRECDAVVFVDCPREERLARVKASRGWDEAELTRREAAQWPLERKRAACRFVVHNDRAHPDLERQVGEVLGALGVARAAC